MNLIFRFSFVSMVFPGERNLPENSALVPDGELPEAAELQCEPVRREVVEQRAFKARDDG
jgi:hypothetical protein